MKSGTDPWDGFRCSSVYSFCLALVMFCAAQHQVVAAATGPVSVWHGEGDAQDAAGNNHGTLMGGVSFVPGVLGQGFLLDGVNDYVRIPDSASLHLANELTVEMWFKREDASSYGTLIDKRNWTTCNYGVIMSADWGFQLYYSQGGFSISFSEVPSAGVFHHLAGTYRQTDSGHVELKTYLDGQLARTDTFPGNLENTFNADALAIGTARDGASDYFRGVIDEVALYGRALSASEVLSNYTALATNLPPPPPPPPPSTNTGLVALWQAEGNAQDSAGNNHGTLMGGVNFVPGVLGQGFLLDGVNDYVRIPDSASLHLANELTVEMWFKREDASSYGTLIDKRNWTTCNYGVIMSAEWGFQLYYNDPSINDGNQFEISFSPVPAPGEFHHLAGTLRQVDLGHVELKTYIDGQLIRTDTRRGNLANTFNANALAIGSGRDGAADYFRGVIDEVALYGRALTASEVLSNYTALATNLPPPPPPPPPSTNEGGIVALWHGEGNGQDSAGNNHGTLMGGVGFVPGVLGQGFLLDGVNDYVRIPDSASLHLANELTVEMWFKREDASSYGTLIDKRNWTTCNYGVIMSAEWGFQLYYSQGGFRISFSEVPSAGVFHHLAGTYRQTDSSHVELKTYLDGQLARTDTLPGNLANTFNADALAIGTARDGASDYFRGVIDEVALYGRALSASEVLSNYTALATNLPPPPPPPPPSTNEGGIVALWHGEGNGQDSAGNNHGTLVGGVGFVPGVLGQGFLLDGVNDYVRIPDSASLHLANELTVEMWFKREDAFSYGTLIDKRNFSTCNFGVIMSADWGFQLYYNDPSINDGNQFEISFSPVPAPGEFHHLAGTLRQVDWGHVELKTYIDGQLIRTDTRRGNLANTFNANALAIGSGRDGAADYFRGVIDEVALYGRALSASEVLSNYTALATNLPPPPPPPPPSTNTGGLVALWHGEGDAQDAAGHNHGTLMGGASFAPGVLGQGFLLDGANDYVRISDSASLHLANELTVEMWFKREDASSYGVLIDKRNLSTCNYGIIMSADWGFQLYYNDPGINDGNQFEISFSGVPSAGVFHHFVGTFRQVDTNHVELKTYMDGQLVRSDRLRGNLANTFNGDALAIGSARNGSDGFFRGIIDEVALYDRALSASEVVFNYANIAAIPQIISHPQSLIGVQGESALFAVSAIGAPPLRYQWRFNGNPITGETNGSLTIPASASADAGTYSVIVTNDSGSVTSSVATLTISASGLPPSFVTPPLASYSASVGTTVTLEASVLGTPPLRFLWTFNGISIPGANNRSLVLSNVQSENAGVYRLVVSNDYGSVASSGSTLNIIQYGNGGTLIFANHSINLVLDVGGSNGVPAGAGYLAALYAGPGPDSLTAIGGAASFIISGRFLGGTRSIPSVPPGQTAYVQVKVWDSKVSSTYEEAVALGAKHGSSPVFTVVLGGGIAPPGILTMPGFALEPGTGVAKRRTARATVGAGIPTTLHNLSRSSGDVSFVVRGPAGTTYAIEVSSDLINWTTVDYVINNSGVLRFRENTPPSGGRRFYRARLITP